ncbi:hypothetical protein AM499_07165 [Bacillus sp. FJAT-22090]|uniref:hypothetical protein n=1 Tax=Bacillus sp. FJAT-22090 TaxID=1581038 RepID=UPI0006AE8080|nr:hypothetical protein [Bacillus sp. FJAT-22090]ALC85624.1 hypothetical protein AM499_07165 [Bacillus sp. FJAT-22090]
MVSSVGILLLATVIVIMEVPSLVQKKLKKELIVFIILLVIGVVSGILYSFDVKKMSPVDLLSYILQPIYNLFSKS